MYGLPKDFDVSVLIGRVLEQVSFTRNQLILVFDQDITITVEGSYAHGTSEEIGPEDVKEPPVAVSTVMELLECRISGAAGESDGTLRLLFDNGHKFVCYNEAVNYEAYRIQVGDTVVVV